MDLRHWSYIPMSWNARTCKTTINAFIILILLTPKQAILGMTTEASNTTKQSKELNVSTVAYDDIPACEKQNVVTLCIRGRNLKVQGWLDHHHEVFSKELLTSLGRSPDDQQVALVRSETGQSLGQLDAETIRFAFVVFTPNDGGSGAEGSGADEYCNMGEAIKQKAEVILTNRTSMALDVSCSFLGFLTAENNASAGGNDVFRDYLPLWALLICVAAILFLSTLCVIYYLCLRRRTGDSEKKRNKKSVPVSDSDEFKVELEPEGVDNPALVYTNMSEFNPSSPPSDGLTTVASGQEVALSEEDLVAYKNGIMPIGDLGFDTEDTKL